MMCNLMYVSVRSCPSDGAESCTKCNSGFRMQKKNGYNVCVKQDTASGLARICPPCWSECTCDDTTPSPLTQFYLCITTSHPLMEQ